MYIRPYKEDNTRSEKTRVSQDLCDLRPTKRFKKDDYYTNFPEYIANLHLYHSGLGGRDPYNRYIEDDCEGEDSWETVSESSLSSDTSSLSWGTAVFSDLQVEYSRTAAFSDLQVEYSWYDPLIPRTITTNDTSSVESILSTYLTVDSRNKEKKIPCTLYYKRTSVKVKVLGFLPDINIPRNESDSPWYSGRPDSPNSEEETYSDSESYNSEIVVLPQYNNYELPEKQKYKSLQVGTRNLSHEGEGDLEEDLEVESAVQALREYLYVVRNKKKRIAEVDDYGIDKWSQNYNPYLCTGTNSFQLVYQGLMKEWIYGEEYLYGNQDIFHTLINSCGCVTPENGYLNLVKVQATQHK